MIRIHMHDQVRNRVENIMTENKSVINWGEILQNVMTLGILGLFFMYSLQG